MFSLHSSKQLAFASHPVLHMCLVCPGIVMGILGGCIWRHSWIAIVCVRGYVCIYFHLRSFGLTWGCWRCCIDVHRFCSFLPTDSLHSEIVRNQRDRTNIVFHRWFPHQEDSMISIESSSHQSQTTTLPETNSSHLKNGDWETTFLFGMALIFEAMLVWGSVIRSITSFRL